MFEYLGVYYFSVLLILVYLLAYSYKITDILFYLSVSVILAEIGDY